MYFWMCRTSRKAIACLCVYAFLRALAKKLHTTHTHTHAYIIGTAHARTLCIGEIIGDLAAGHDPAITHLQDLPLLVWAQGHELPYKHVTDVQPLDAVATDATKKVTPDGPHSAVVAIHAHHCTRLHDLHETVEFLTPLFARVGSLGPNQRPPEFHPRWSHIRRRP